MIHWFILGAVLLAAAAGLWYAQAFGGRVPPPRRPGAGEADAVHRPQPEAAPAGLEELAGAVRELEAVMAHPELGGPGFLTVRFTRNAGGQAVTVVTAQYPNIREAMYRLALRQPPDPAALAEAGVPETLLALSPVFETDSGGVVLISVSGEGWAAVLPTAGRRERLETLETLSELLGRRFPGLEVRPFGTELLLTPVRERGGE
ncbi:MAG: hypothetical protein HDT14_05725 [Oscillibacter sp.]|nr:hypothetical protein [Oscillibacter sp.]